MAGCVVSYQNKKCIGSGQDVGLDFDVQNGYGPETITLNKLMPGAYSFWVNKYQGSPGSTLMNSGATVQERPRLLAGWLWPFPTITA